jgi:hypothetical protein
MNQATNLRRRGWMEKLDHRFRDKGAVFKKCPKRYLKIWEAITLPGTNFYRGRYGEHGKRAHSPQLAAWVSERTTINRHFPCMEDSLHYGCESIPAHLVQGASIFKNDGWLHHRAIA